MSSLIIQKRHGENAQHSKNNTMSLEQAIEISDEVSLSIEQESAELNKLFQQEEMLNNTLKTLEDAQQDLERSQESDDVNTNDLMRGYQVTLENYLGEDIDELSQEAIGEITSRVIQGLANVTGRIERSMRDFFSSIFEGAEGLQKRLEEVKSKVNSTYDVPENETIKVSGGSRLHINNTMDPKKLSEGYPKAGETVDTYVASIPTVLNQLIEYLEDRREQLNELDRREVGRKDLKEFSRQSRVGFSKIIDEWLQTMKGYRGTKLPGGMKMATLIKDNFYIDLEGGKGSDIKIPIIINDNRMGEYKEKEYVDLPSPEQLLEVVTGVEFFINSITQRQRELNRALENINELKGMNDQVSKLKERYTSTVNLNLSAPGFVGASVGVFIRNLFGNNVSNWRVFFKSSFVQSLRYNYQTSRSAIAYCEKSVKKYKWPR